MPNWMIRGVTVAGWLVLERWITPYLFAITTCHLERDFCRYPDPIGDYEECDFDKCKPVLQENPMTLEQDYPRTEAQLTRAFDDPYLSSRYLEHHYESFLTKKDIVRLHDAGVTHLKVPMPHLSKQENKAWLYFVRLVSWCRDVGGLHVWPDVRFGGFITSENNEQCWLDSPLLINRTLEMIQTISLTIMRDGLRDVVTGFGLHDVTDEHCHDSDDEDKRVLFYGQALDVIRSNMGHNTSILVTGTNVTRCDEWWNDTDHVHFNVIAKQPRAVEQLSPRQQIAYVCRHANNTNVTSECNTTHNIVREWSSAAAPTEQEVSTVMHGIQYNHTAPYVNRTLSKPYKKFLRHVSQAHMVTYEQSMGWFYGTIKVEGGAFAEHDFLRGIREGWIPKLNGVGANESCEDVLFQQHDDMSIVQEYPFLDSNLDVDDEFNDDLVRSHGDSLLKGGKDNNDDDGDYEYDDDDDDDDDQVQEPPVADESDDDETLPSKDSSSTDETTTKKKGGVHFFTLVALAFFAYGVKRVFFSPDEWRRNRGYSSVDSSQHSVTIAV